MKRIIFSLIALFVMTTSFSTAPVVENTKDNWVYNLNKPVKPLALTATAWYSSPSVCDGMISINVTSDDVQSHDRQIGITIKFKKSVGAGFVYMLVYSTMPANVNYVGIQ